MGATVQKFSGGAWAPVGNVRFANGTNSGQLALAPTTNTPYFAFFTYDASYNSFVTVMSYQ